MGRSLDEVGLDGLPETFTYSDARDVMNERRFRALVAQGAITRLHRGLYRKVDAGGDENLIEIAARRPTATLCLRSALARHDLIDDIPSAIDIALPRGTNPTRAPLVPIVWHHFDRRTFRVGRDVLPLDDHTTIGVYSPERSIVDAYRLRHREGAELAHEALRRWLSSGGQPARLMQVARDFPKAEPGLRAALEVLL